MAFLVTLSKRPSKPVSVLMPLQANIINSRPLLIYQVSLRIQTAMTQMGLKMVLTMINKERPYQWPVAASAEEMTGPLERWSICQITNRTHLRAAAASITKAAPRSLARPMTPTEITRIEGVGAAAHHRLTKRTWGFLRIALVTWRIILKVYRKPCRYFSTVYKTHISYNSEF